MSAAQTWRLADFLSRSTDTDFSETTLAKVLGTVPTLSAAGPWIAGGAIRRTIMGKEPESDFDFFFRDADQLGTFADGLLERGYRKVRETEHHIQFRGAPNGGVERDVQLIRFKYYQSAEDVIDSFDFTICMVAFDGETLTAGEYALFDLGRQTLAIHQVTFPVSTMRRMIKYTKQGFRACPGAMATILRETATNPELMAKLDIQYVD
jgi:hypothetical protein